MSIKEAMVMMRVRWQIELLFKLPPCRPPGGWKNEGHIDSWRSEKPWRILCEFYAKLIVMVIQSPTLRVDRLGEHWILLVGCWEYSNRSFTKASKAIRNHAMNIAVAFAKDSLERLIETLEIIKRSLSSGCKIYKRKSDPSTYQILLSDTS